MTRDGGQVPGARPPRPPEAVERQRSAGPVKPAPPARPAAPALAATHPRRPSLGGGAPAQGRELGRQGQRTVRKLLEAGLAEFDENGFQAVRVDDVVRRANISHGTFYLYFSNKDDLFKTLLRDALDDMQVITDDFPVVTRNESGLAALRKWTAAVLRHLRGARGRAAHPDPGRRGRRGGLRGRAAACCSGWPRPSPRA